MPIGYAKGRNIVFPEMARRSDAVVMKTLGNTANNLSRTNAVNQHDVASRTRPVGIQPSAHEPIAEWRQRRPERFPDTHRESCASTLAPSQPVTTANVVVQEDDIQ